MATFTWKVLHTWTDLLLTGQFSRVIKSQEKIKELQFLGSQGHLISENHKLNFISPDVPENPQNHLTITFGINFLYHSKTSFPWNRKDANQYI